jgi:hypothetical protein
MTDVGQKIFCRVTATNASGSAQAFSNVVGPVVAGSGTFTPADLPGVFAWYKSDAGLYSDAGTTPIVDGVRIGQWNNQVSGGQHLLQAAPTTNGPMYDSTGFNTTHPAAIIDWVGEYMMTAADVVVHGGGGLLSVFIVCNFGSVIDANGRVIAYLGTGVDPSVDYSNAASAIALLATSATQIGGMRGGIPNGVATITTNTNYRIGSIFDGTEHKIYINNNPSTGVASTGTFTSPGRLTFGITGTSLTLTVTEIVATSTALDTTQRFDLDNYFKAKWGLS